MRLEAVSIAQYRGRIQHSVEVFERWVTMPDQTSCLAPHNGRVHSQPSERTNTAGKQVSNTILLSTSDSDYSSLRPHLKYINLPNHLVLHEAGGKLEFAYFPNRGLISLVVVMKDGKTAEAAIVGNEGLQEQWRLLA